ncbi:unnamed protein product [Prorocentrum cordatum]|nr:unnamed protein product [Polarella glacialis]
MTRRAGSSFRGGISRRRPDMSQQDRRRPREYPDGVMASLAGVQLPAVRAHSLRRGPVAAWAEAPTASPAPRQISIPRMAGGRPGAGRWLQISAFDPERVRRASGLQSPRPPPVAAPWTLNGDLPYMTRPAMRTPGQGLAPLSGTSGRLVAEALTAPELPTVQLASSRATSYQPSDTASISGLSAESRSHSKASAVTHRAGARAREAEQPGASPRPASATGVPPATCHGPPGPDGRGEAPSGAGPGHVGGELAGPRRPREAAPARARPGQARRSLSARGSRRAPSAPSWGPASLQTAAEQPHSRGRLGARPDA